MPFHRKAVFDVVRPWLDRKGFTAARVRELDSTLERIGIPPDTANPSPAPAPVPLPSTMPPPIAMVTGELLGIVSKLHAADREAWAAAIRAACLRFDMTTIRRVAAFIAQMAHESLGFTRLNENLNYTSAERIKAVFGQGAAGRRRFPMVGSCQPYVRQPQKLANYVYANRMGNGPPESGDGWRFRGGAGIGLTGRNNWAAFAAAMGMSIDEALAYGRTVEGGVAAAAWFWEENDINRLADTPGVTDESRAINGGENGLADRKAKFDALVDAMLQLERKAG